MLSSDRPEQTADEGVLSDAKPACVALVPVVASAQWAIPSRLSRPDSIFLTHLIATAEQVPQNRSLRRAIVQFGSEPGSDRFARVQMIPLGFTHEEPIDGFEALGVERREIRPGHGTVVRRDGVDRDIQRVTPARAE